MFMAASIAVNDHGGGGFGMLEALLVADGILTASFVIMLIFSLMNSRKP